SARSARSSRRKRTRAKSRRRAASLGLREVDRELAPPRPELPANGGAGRERRRLAVLDQPALDAGHVAPAPDRQGGRGGRRRAVFGAWAPVRSCPGGLSAGGAGAARNLGGRPCPDEPPPSGVRRWRAAPPSGPVWSVPPTRPARI